MTSPDNSYDEPEEDFSDVLEIPAGLVEESNAFHTRVAKGRWVRSWTIANAFVTALLFAESAIGLWVFDLDADSYAVCVWTTFVVAKFLGVAFLYSYLRSLDPRVLPRSPRRVALLNLIPGFELYWSFFAFRESANAGIANIEALDGNRRLYRAPTTLADVACSTRVAALLTFLGIVFFALTSADGDYRDGNRIVDATVMATAVFGLVTLAPTLASFGFVGYGWIAFFTSAQILALVAIATRMALIWQMARIANFANDTKGLTERHATAGERAEERARVDRLFGNAKTTSATAESPNDGRAFSDDIDKV